MEVIDSYILNGESFYIRELNHSKDQKLFDEIVEHEDKVFGDGSVGKWNIKPFAKYGKVFAVVKKTRGRSVYFSKAALSVEGIIMKIQFGKIHNCCIKRKSKL